MTNYLILSAYRKKNLTTDTHRYIYLMIKFMVKTKEQISRTKYLGMVALSTWYLVP